MAVKWGSDLKPCHIENILLKSQPNSSVVVFNAIEDGPTPLRVIACTEKLYSVYWVNLSKDTLVAVVTLSTIVASVLQIKTNEYATICPRLLPQSGSDQVNVIVFVVTTVALTSVGGPKGTANESNNTHYFIKYPLKI